MISKQLNNTLAVFESHVASRYQIHEQTFDLESFHGRFHILRCLLLADCIHQFYEGKALDLDIQKSYYAILFHDIMRENNGIDLWEPQSANECLIFLKQNGYNDEYAFQTSKIILKSNDFNLEEQVLYDVDVLDYHRFFFLPEERHLFDDYKLKFAGPKDKTKQLDISAREKIILLAEQLVRCSETLPVSISTNELIKIVLDYYLKIKPW
jgi:hypothetical protein